jgi:hypothetical protein
MLAIQLYSIQWIRKSPGRDFLILDRVFERGLQMLSLCIMRLRIEVVFLGRVGGNVHFLASANLPQLSHQVPNLVLRLSAQHGVVGRLASC